MARPSARNRSGVLSVLRIAPDHRLAAAERQVGHGVLVAHAFGQTQRIDEGVVRGRVVPHPASAGGRTARRRMDRDDRAEAGLLVEEMVDAFVAGEGGLVEHRSLRGAGIAVGARIAPRARRVNLCAEHEFAYRTRYCSWRAARIDLRRYAARASGASADGAAGSSASSGPDRPKLAGAAAPGRAGQLSGAVQAGSAGAASIGGCWLRLRPSPLRGGGPASRRPAFRAAPRATAATRRLPVRRAQLRESRTILPNSASLGFGAQPCRAEIRAAQRFRLKAAVGQPS